MFTPHTDMFITYTFMFNFFSVIFFTFYNFVQIIKLVKKIILVKIEKKAFSSFFASCFNGH